LISDQINKSDLKSNQINNHNF